MVLRHKTKNPNTKEKTYERLILLIFATLVACLPVSSQITLNAGDSFTYQFTSLPDVIVPADGFGTRPVGVFIVNLSGFNVGTDMLRVEMFENSLSEAPAVTFVAEQSLDGTSFDGWADFQGVVRLTMLSGSVTVDSMTFFHQVPLDDFSGRRYQLTVVPVAVDSDGDGVLDGVDQCPNTPAGAVVDEHGCSIDELVPCAGPLSGGTWRNHGQYVLAVGRAAAAFHSAGLITASEKRAIIRAALRSGCGRRH